VIKPAIHIFAGIEALVNRFSTDLYQEIYAKKGRFHLVLSGGSTPRQLYSYWADFFKDKLDIIKKVHFYWGDERCVPPDNHQSNFGMVQEVFFSRLALEAKQIHRMRGEAEPRQEALRYGLELTESVPVNDMHIPVFDHILLGLGSDGHTASIFPGSPVLKIRDEICAAACHPETGQNRLSLTLAVINRARRITFIITGADKQEIVADIFSQHRQTDQYPAALVQPETGHLSLYLDAAAADKLVYT
jgi:6-phosphogluconolactonase